MDFGLSRDIFASLDRKIDNGTFGNLHALLVVLDGKLIYERYIPGYEYGLDPMQDHGRYIHYTADHLHDIASITKAIVFLGTGIALDKGFLQSLDQKVASFFPEYGLPVDSPWWKTSLYHLLTMTAGFAWVQAGDDSDTDQLFDVVDPIRFILVRPFTNEPGTAFLYNQGCPTLLAEILRRATGKRLDSFVHAWLFAPLGIEAAEWKMLPHGVVYAGGDLRMRPRDLATIGLLIQNGGRYGDAQVISAAYVREATTGRFDGGPGLYGYFWWTIQSSNRTISSAMGRGGQGIFIYPGGRLMMVCTGGSWNKVETGNEPYYPYDILRQEIDPLYDQLPIQSLR